MTDDLDRLVPDDDVDALRSRVGNAVDRVRARARVRKAGVAFALVAIAIAGAGGIVVATVPHWSEPASYPLTSAEGSSDSGDQPVAPSAMPAPAPPASVPAPGGQSASGTDGFGPLNGAGGCEASHSPTPSASPGSTPTPTPSPPRTDAAPCG